MGHNSRKERALTLQKFNAQVIVEYVLDEIEKDETKVGVLLCEGDENSIDKMIYFAVFPNLVIVPCGSCCNIMRSLNRIKKILALNKIYAFGIIDRDALSKSEIKKLRREKGVYTTKLPFIENIACAPEVIRYVCEALNLDYNLVIDKIGEQLIKILWQKLKEALPINWGIEKNERIGNLQIGAFTNRRSIEKIVDKDTILYTYRSKIIVSIVANAMKMHRKEEYYAEIKRMLEDEKHRAKLVKVMSTFIPNMLLYDLEEF